MHWENRIKMQWKVKNNLYDLWYIQEFTVSSLNREFRKSRSNFVRERAFSIQLISHVKNG